MSLSEPIVYPEKSYFCFWLPRRETKEKPRAWKVRHLVSFIRAMPNYPGMARTSTTSFMLFRKLLTLAVCISDSTSCLCSINHLPRVTVRLSVSAQCHGCCGFDTTISCAGAAITMDINNFPCDAVWWEERVKGLTEFIMNVSNKHVWVAPS